MSSATITLNRVEQCPLAPHSGCWGSTSFGTLSYNGKTVNCNASGNRSYNIDVTVRPSDCYESKKSTEFNVSMPFAVGPVEWKTGVYIHQYPFMCSAGCIHLNQGDAKNFHDWVKSKSSVRIIIKSTY